MMIFRQGQREFRFIFDFLLLTAASRSLLMQAPLVADACGFQFAAACFGYGNAHRECASAVHFRLECFADLLSTVRLATRIIP